MTGLLAIIRDRLDDVGRSKDMIDEFRYSIKTC
jgi:hypothetical protein